MTHSTETAFVENPDVVRGEPDARAGDADGEVEGLLARSADEHAVDPDTVQDVPCGIGRHAVAPADRGREVTGADIPREYL